MQVVAVSTPGDRSWRWRIVDYAGAVLEESRERFTTIHSALGQGTRRMTEMNVVDRSVPPQPYRYTSHLRGR
jgi:hypothetical protein